MAEVRDQAIRHIDGGAREADQLRPNGGPWLRKAIAINMELGVDRIE